MKFEIAQMVVQQFSYCSQHSEERIQHIDFSCPNHSKLVAASCIEHDSRGFLQVAITTINKDGSVSCERYGPDAQAKVMATAICFKVKSSFQ